MIRRILSPKSVETETPRGFDAFELRLGDVMRGERATLGKSLLDVQRELKVKASYIAAIENADPDAFETPGFVAGYVRSYARYLNMDPEWAYEKFCAEASFEVQHGMVAQSGAVQAAKAERRARTTTDPLGGNGFVPRREAFLSKIEPAAIGSVLVLLMLVGGIGYGGWSVLQEIQRVQFAPVAENGGVASGLDPLDITRAGGVLDSAIGGDVLPVENDSQETQVAAVDSGVDVLERLYRPEALEVPVLVSRDAPISSLNPDDIGTLAPAGGAQQLPLDRAIAEAMADPEEATVQVIAEAPPAVSVFAVRPAWVRISSADGTVIFEKILAAGEEYILPAVEDAPFLRAGNSGSVYFSVNGETFGPAGAAGSVAKNVELAAASLSEGYDLADPSQDGDLAKVVAELRGLPAQ